MRRESIPLSLARNQASALDLHHFPYPYVLTLGYRVSSVRRSVQRDWGGVDLYGGVAGEGSHTIGERLNFSFISSKRMGSWPRKK
jgi:hypothetical protein